MAFLVGAWLLKKTGLLDKAGEVVENAVTKHCTFVNDTKYEVEIIDHDGTRILKPNESQANYLVTGFSVDLVMKISGKEEKINFPSSKFENRTHKMSHLFEESIREFEMKVLEAFSMWELVFNHHGGYEVKLSSKVITKNSWKEMLEQGVEAKATVGAMIKAVELSATFKAHTNLTRVDEYESETTETSERTLKDRCYIWQEIVVVKTNQTNPFNELRVPTQHTEMTSTPNKPPKEWLLYCKGM